jgi:hypothetical protein
MHASHADLMSKTDARHAHAPHDWRRANHQEAYDRNNAQQYIEAGYDPSTKAKHKTQLPSF